MRFLTFIFAALFIFSPLVASAANIYVSANKLWINVEGEIVPGDFSRLVNTLSNTGTSIGTVAIFSKGGGVNEAIKIGNLIRDLRLHTLSAKGFGAQGNVCGKIFDQSNCTCLSACVLIFAAGVNRYGNVLGVHRSYVSHDILKSMGGYRSYKRIEGGNGYRECLSVKDGCSTANHRQDECRLISRNNLLGRGCNRTLPVRLHPAVQRVGDCQMR